MRVTEQARSENMLLGTIGPIFVSVWNGDPTGSDYDILEEEQRKFLQRQPRIYNAAIVTRVTGSSKALQLAKERGIPFVKKIAPKLAGTSTVIIASGLAASVARSFTSAFNLMSGITVPSRVFAEIDECVAWFSNLNDQTAGIIEKERVAIQIAGFVSSFKAPEPVQDLVR